MSILMRGVDMPKNCEECNFKGECRQYWEKIREAYTRPSWCPLVEVADRKTEPQIEPNLIFPERIERGERYEVGETIVVMNRDDYYDLLCKSWKDESHTDAHDEAIKAMATLIKAKDEPQTAECPFDDKIPCEWVCTEYGKCKYKPKTEPQTDKEIILDPSFAELSDEQFAEAMKLIVPQTDIGTSDTVYSDTAGYVPRVDMTDCSWK